MNLMFLCKYIPFSKRAKRTMLFRISSLLKEGVGIIEVFQFLSIDLSNKRLKFICIELHAMLQIGERLEKALSVFPLLFTEELINNIQFASSGSSIKLHSILDLYIDKLKASGELVQSIILSNLPLFVFTVGLYIGIYYNTVTDLLPLYDFLKKGSFKIPSLSQAFIVEFYVFNSYILPVTFFLILAPIINSITKFRFLKIVNDFIAFYIPPFSISFNLNVRISFMNILNELSKSGSTLQAAIFFSKLSFSNFFINKNLSNSISKLKEGYSFSDSFKNSTLLSPLEIDLLFSSTDSFISNIGEVQQRYFTKREIMTKTLSAILRLSLIFFNIFWIMSYVLAWVDLILVYLIK